MQRGSWKVSAIDVKILDPRPYLARNRDIVDASDLMLACPAEQQEVLRSGTWATIRYALKRDKHLIVIHPNGAAVEHNG